jgi:inosine-uridine nucleoside N-ribohydrolase
MRRAARIGLGIVLALALLLAITLAMPVPAWRTGEPPPLPLETRPGRPLGPAPLRVWIDDTDAACGRDARTDPDDCLALLLLAHTQAVRLAGISTVFGNAPLDVTDRTTRALVARLGAGGRFAPAVHRGAASANQGAETAASRALRQALRAGPLVIVALGPLTNVAAALEREPALARNVRHLVAVMGRRRGHLFHPVEGGQAGSFLGHGPVFRDFNFAKDPDAAETVLEHRPPLTLVPYEAAREIVLGRETLDRMASRGGAARWVAARSRDWLAYWREEIGTQGFYPFDLVAAVYAIEPAMLECARTSVRVGKDAGLLGRLGRDGLFVDSAGAGPTALYCPDVRPSIARWLGEHGL